MKKINKKAFTLIELLVAISILGLITVIALPQISNIQESNRKTKYKKYAESMITSAKLYTDSYTEDMFGYSSGCYDITYKELKDKGLVKDIKVDGASCHGGSLEKTFVRVYRSNDNYTYAVSIYCVDKNNTKVYEESLLDDDICDGTRPDTTSPTISISPNSMGWTTGKNKKVKISVWDAYGMLENTKIKYAWTKNPSSLKESDFKEYDFRNIRGEGTKTKKLTLTIDVPQNKTGIYYLVVKPEEVRDVNNNYQSKTITSNKFKLDNTSPKIEIEAYKRKEEGGSVGKKLKSVIADNSNKVATLNLSSLSTNSWLNSSDFPAGVYFKISYSDTGELSTYLDKRNKANLKISTTDDKSLTTTNKEESLEGQKGDMTAAITGDGYRTMAIIVTDKAGNSSRVNIEIPLDRKAPTLPTVTLKKWSNNSTEPTANTFNSLSTYTAGSWSKYKIQARASNSTDTISGGVYYQATTTGTTENVTNRTCTAKNVGADGESKIKYRACDAAGNCSDYTTEKTIKIDKQAPPAPIVALVDGTWTAKANNTWYNENIYVSGQAKKSDPNPVSDDGTGSGIKKYQISTDNSTWVDWNYDYTKSIYKINTTGTHKRYIRAVDNAGNVSDVTTKTIKVDKDAPSKPTVALVDGNWNTLKNNTWYNKNVYVAGQANKNNPNPVSTDTGGSGIKKYQISTNNSTWTDWNYDYNSSVYKIETNGTTRRYIRAVDNAGNISEVTTKTIKVDKADPTCGTVSGASTTWAKSRTITQNCTDTGGSGCEKASYSKSYNTKTTTGSITIKDNAGNTKSCSFNVYVDPNYSAVKVSGNIANWVCGKCNSGTSGCANSKYYRAQDDSGNILYTADNRCGNSMGKVTASISGNKVTFSWQVRQGGATHIDSGHWVKFIIKNSSGTQVYSEDLKTSSSWSSGSKHSGSLSYTFTKKGTYKIYIDGSSGDPSFDMNFGTITVS